MPNHHRSCSPRSPRQMGIPHRLLARQGVDNQIAAIQRNSERQDRANDGKSRDDCPPKRIFLSDLFDRDVVFGRATILCLVSSHFPASDNTRKRSAQASHISGLLFPWNNRPAWANSSSAGACPPDGDVRRTGLADIDRLMATARGLLNSSRRKPPSPRHATATAESNLRSSEHLLTAEIQEPNLQ